VCVRLSALTGLAGARFTQSTTRDRVSPWRVPSPRAASAASKSHERDHSAARESSTGSMNSAEQVQASTVATEALVPGRSCGYCTVCCYATQIDTPEFQKSPGVVCSHCTGKGCGVYETRYAVCRQFHCGWWYWDQVGEDWRPDLSGVLILPQETNLPAGHKKGWQFLLIGGEPAIRRAGFIEGVFAFLRANAALCVVAPAPPGQNGRAAFVNEFLRDAATRDDRQMGINLLVQLWRTLVNGPFDPATFENRAPDAV
jgi:hypothetical protein